ncbi:MAG: 50S ribosomal protein L4 [Candidatus Kapabacteria bacterium]|nr:50S ribosomal protein L4 [Candidatus Kapabacteria bacterium]
MKVDVLSISGQKSGEVELPDDIFGIEPNEHVMYQAVRVYLAHQRQGTHKTKTRTEVSGGGKKPWKQKGRGTARAGSSRSPVWVGGGTVFGPKPHKYTIDIPRKMKRLARKSAFSCRASEQNIIVVEDFTFNDYKTKNMVAMLKALNISGEKALVLLPETIQNVVLSGRNIPKLKTAPADKISTYDILNHKKIVITKSAIDTIVATFAGVA